MHYTCRKCGWSGEVKSRPRCLPCYSRRTRQWRRDNPDKARAQKNRWIARRVAQEPGYLAKRKRTKRANNPETDKRHRKQRKEWLQKGTVTRSELQRIWARDNGKCRYCGKSGFKPRFNPLDHRGFDHVVPRAKGGLHEAINIVVCCRECNSRKGASEPRKWSP